MVKRVAGWYRERQRKTRMLLATLVVLCVVMSGAYLGRGVIARHIATTMTVTVTCAQSNDVCSGAGEVVFHHTYGPLDAQDAQWRLMLETDSYSFRNRGSILEGGLNLRYHLVFTCLGYTVETADTWADSIPESWVISSPGMAQPSTRIDWNGSVMAEIVRDSGGHMPSPSDPNWRPTAGS